jgi:predicted transcriptional regulator
MPKGEHAGLNILKYTKVGVMYMDVCTIRLHRKTKSYLDTYREYRNESYDEVVMKLVGIAKAAKEEPELSREAVEKIEAARKRIKAGKFYTEEEVTERLGWLQVTEKSLKKIWDTPEEEKFWSKYY